MSSVPQRVEVVAGAEFVVELEFTPSSGASWTWQPSADAELVREERRSLADAVGGPVLHAFTFRCARRGSFVLTFVLKRAWEAAVRRSVDIHVEVR